MNAHFLQTPIEYLKGVGPNRADLLKKELGIHTFQDLMHLFPNRYLDRTKYYRIGELQKTNAEVQIIGKITHIKTVEQKRGKRLVATFIDDTGQMELVWFRGHKWIRENLKLNVPYVIFGKTNWFNGLYSMPHPEMELLEAHEKSLRSAMQPIYPSTEKLSSSGITNKVISTLLETLFLEAKNRLAESLSKEVLNSLKLLPKNEALFNIHFPKNQTLLSRAQYRLKFEELFYIQLQLIRKNILHKTKIKGYTFPKVGDYFNTFFNEHLPFNLTEAQKRVIKEIRHDLGQASQMNRLLQGDVGSGKTIVAFMSLLIALDNGFQGCLMAPTEILSVQHYNSLLVWCNKLNISISILTGSTKLQKEKKFTKTFKMGLYKC